MRACTSSIHRWLALISRIFPHHWFVYTPKYFTRNPLSFKPSNENLSANCSLKQQCRPLRLRLWLHCVLLHSQLYFRHGLPNHQRLKAVWRSRSWFCTAWHFLHQPIFCLLWWSYLFHSLFRCYRTTQSFQLIGKGPEYVKNVRWLNVPALNGHSK